MSSNVAKKLVETGALERFFDALSISDVGVFQMDYGTGLMHWNEPTAMFLGYDKAKNVATRDDFYNRVYPADIPKIQDALQEALKTDATFEIEFRVIWPNGEIHWLCAKCAIKLDKNRLPLTSGGIFLNIDKKKQEEQALKIREHGFRRLYDSNILGISFWSMDSGIYEANDAYLKIIGLTREKFEAIRPLDWKAITPVKFLELNERMTQKALDSGVSDVFEKEYILEDGTTVPILLGIAQHGDTRKGIAFVLDISKQKEADQLLRQSHEKYASFISQSSEGIWCFELNEPMPIDMPIAEQLDFFYDKAYLAECNDALARIYGYESAAEIIGSRFNTFFPRTSFNEAYLESFIKNGYNVSNAESEEVDRSGRKICICSSLKGFIDNGKLKRAWGLQRNITAQKETEAELIRAREQAETANNAKTSFIANVSHEIRTPLGAILGFSEFLHESTFSASDKKNFREIIRRNGVELTRLIDDILDLSKVEAGYLEVVHSEFGVGDLIADVFGILKPKAEAKGIRLTAIFDPSSHKRICSDPSRVRQILINLVTNAIKFTERGEVCVEVQYQEGKAGFAEFIIKDSGIGISNENAETLFKPFSQGDSSTTRRFGGTGLGLALSKKLALALDGNVILERSNPSQGSTFKFTVRDYMNDAKTSNFTFQSKLKAPRRNLKGVKVLVVDDSPDNRLLMERLLKKHGIKVDVSVDGANGVQRALTRDYDVVLMDLQMPIMDGYTATKVLRQRGYSKPIIALTAHAMIEDRDKCLNIGCSDHLGKPVSSEELLRKISQHA